MTTYVSTSVPVTRNAATYLDSEFRTWVGEMRAMFAALGLVQTSDTGQLNPATITCPSVNTYPGYEIWRWSDAAQATDPIFMKIEYGKNGWSTAWAMRISVGQGSNGSGTLTGQVSTPLITYGHNSTQNSTPGSGQHYGYFGNGNLWIADAAVNNVTQCFPYSPRNYFNIARTRDGSGNLDGRGVVILIPAWGGAVGNNSIQFVRWASGLGFIGTATNAYCAVVGNQAVGSDVDASGNKLAWPHWYWDSGITQAWATWSAQRSGLPSSPTSFTASPYGTSRTWISWQTAPMAHVRTAFAGTDMDAQGTLCMLWE